ncbi:MAG: hypothetical protein HOO67_02795, partial [Candidatus Peribacteraceae bacterium]|nr:hypothetical protein [Candidatus Peribacteraceae bacterium]
MFSNKKLFIGVFLASLGTLAIVGGRLPSLRGTAFTGQATGIPESSSSAFSSARSSSSTRSGTNSSEDGKQTSKSSAGDDGCSGQKTMYPDDYKKVAKGETIVHVWEEIFTGIKRQ